MDDFYTQFRANVFGSHIRTPWAKRLYDTLNFVTEYPQYAMMIGLIPCNATSFYVNSHQLGDFFGLTANAINRDLRQHGFKLDNTCDVSDELRMKFAETVFSSRRWGKRVFTLGRFDAIGGTEVVVLASDHARMVRSGQNIDLNQEQHTSVNVAVTTDTADTVDWNSRLMFDEWSNDELQFNDWLSEYFETFET
jgi:Na+-transporting NADH:ubiquinone oxidoreductase subunit NqrF